MRLIKRFGGRGLFAGTVSSCHVSVTAGAPRGGGGGIPASKVPVCLYCNFYLV